MYNRIKWPWLESTYLAVGEGKVLFSRNVKPGVSGLGIARKETFLAYSTQFVLLIIRFVPGNVVVAAIDMCGKITITGDWIYGITWIHVYFNISVHFIVDTMIILKSVFLNYFLFESGQSLEWLYCCYNYCFCNRFSIVVTVILIFVYYVCHVLL